ncbi:hypothetical protein CerSpe_114930 [Prunus speciosa]
MKEGSRGVGCDVRDSLGSLVGAVSMQPPGRVSFLATELYAIKIGLSFALDATFVPLVVESDSLLAGQLVTSDVECLAMEGGLVDEIRKMLKSGPQVAVQHISRKANMIAKFNLRVRGFDFWFEVGRLGTLTMCVVIVLWINLLVDVILLCFFGMCGTLFYSEVYPTEFSSGRF